ncbi:hypothetical protein TNCV_2803661 [Trichonephila clavipes]|nr:hypothetical protein TNCV_2803661 [Trichonephila clavipes]
MFSPGFEPSPYGTAFSVANHYIGWATSNSIKIDSSAIPGGRGSLVIKVPDRDWLVTSSIPVPLKTRRVGERCTLNLSRAQMSSRWCCVVVRRGR